MSNYKDGYIGYQEMIADITTALESTKEIMRKLELEKQAKTAEDASNHLKSHIFSVGVMGEFKRGKSTVINALLGEEIAPADIAPASATLNRITYGLTPKATIIYKDGRQEEVPVNKIADYVTKITEDSAVKSESVEQAVVEYPCQFCQNNVEIIDTPGLNDDERMDAISESVIPYLDAVVFVVVPNNPFSASERDFVQRRLMSSDIGRLIILVNRIDDVKNEKDRQKVLTVIRDRINKEILEHTALIYGEDSKQYQDAKIKLSNIVLYPISAYDALVGRTENKPELVEQSGILAFEDRLRTLLTQERGSIEIMKASGIIAGLLAEGENALNIRLNALEMDTEKFLTNQKQAEEKISELRDRKKSEALRIRGKRAEIYRKIDELIQEKYDEFENHICDYFRNYNIPASIVKSKETINRFMVDSRTKLEGEIKKTLKDYTEQINASIMESIGDERIKVEEFLCDVSGSLSDISEKMSKSSKNETLCILGVDALSNFIAAWSTGILSVGGAPLMGLGGMIEGYRVAGKKGAATGLVSGFASSVATSFLLVTALGSVPIIPFAIITGIAGTLGGKFITSKIWGKDIQSKKIEEVREALIKVGKESVSNLRNEKLLENWADEQITSQLDLLVQQSDQEAENMITSTEDTLKAIAADIAVATQNKEERKKEYNAIQERVKTIKRNIEDLIQAVAPANTCQG